MARPIVPGPAPSMPRHPGPAPSMPCHPGPIPRMPRNPGPAPSMPHHPRPAPSMARHPPCQCRHPPCHPPCRAAGDGGLLAQDARLCTPPAPSPCARRALLCPLCHTAVRSPLSRAAGVEGAHTRGGSPRCDLQVTAASPSHNRGLRGLGQSQRGPGPHLVGLRSQSPGCSGSCRRRRRTPRQEPGGYRPFSARFFSWN